MLVPGGVKSVPGVMVKGSRVPEVYPLLASQPVRIGQVSAENKAVKWSFPRFVGLWIRFRIGSNCVKSLSG